MIAIIKYNAGNVTSIKNAINRLGGECIITDDKDKIRNAAKVILPGVGNASPAMKYLREKRLDEIILSLQQPVLGICLGLQLLCSDSEEGETSCLRIFNTSVKKFPSIKKVPHMGWNNFISVSGTLFKNVLSENDVYFVHSYYAEICSRTIAACDYILPFSAALQKDNFYATQFHPEKSADVGETILKNFLEL